MAVNLEFDHIYKRKIAKHKNGYKQPNKRTQKRIRRDGEVIMDKLEMQSKNLVDENIDFIAKRFPNCITEAMDENGKLTKLVDFDLLKQELSKDIVDGNDERYILNWAGKKQSILTANSPINATLRPCKKESVDFDNTKNLYIEGDNLDVLKLLRETYMSKIKMIYIDPPYNTGNDFVYEDDFASSTEDYLQASKSYDDQGNRMFQNNDSNGRFHSDWLSMMYSRLKLAKDLLTDDGVILISIDENEFINMGKICDEIFGRNNFVECFVFDKKAAAKGVPPVNMVVGVHEYIFAYCKDKLCFKFLGLKRSKNDFSNPDNDPRGLWRNTNIKSTISERSYTIVNPETGDVFTDTWAFSPAEMQKMIDSKQIIFPKNKNGQVRAKEYYDEFKNLNTPIKSSLGLFDAQWNTEMITKLMGGKFFQNPKHLKLIHLLIQFTADKDDIILDFFSGSATTAHAVMQLNAEDGGNRKFVMVQLPEKCDEKSEAYKAGYKNICEIGKERIRRAGKKIKEENPNATNLDIGFRDLKLDSSCMKDTYYSPNKTTQDLLTGLVDNIKEDRTPEDLLFQVMLDMGVLLSSEIKTLEINGKKVFNVNDGDLVCCFDKNIDDDTVTQIAKMKPLYAVFRDASMSTDSMAVNFDQIFETYSPTTTRKII